MPVREIKKIWSRKTGGSLPQSLKTELDGRVRELRAKGGSPGVEDVLGHSAEELADFLEKNSDILPTSLDFNALRNMILSYKFLLTYGPSLGFSEELMNDLRRNSVASQVTFPEWLAEEVKKRRLGIGGKEEAARKVEEEPLKDKEILRFLSDPSHATMIPQKTTAVDLVSFILENMRPEEYETDLQARILPPEIVEELKRLKDILEGSSGSRKK